MTSQSNVFSQKRRVVVTRILLVMFLGCLVLRQSSFVFVSANERKLKPLAPLDGIGDRRPADGKLSILDTRQIFQFLQLGHKTILVFLGDIGSEFEQHLSLLSAASHTEPQILSKRYIPMCMTAIVDGVEPRNLGRILVEIVLALSIVETGSVYGVRKLVLSRV